MSFESRFIDSWLRLNASGWQYAHLTLECPACKKCRPLFRHEDGRLRCKRCATATLDGDR